MGRTVNTKGANGIVAGMRQRPHFHSPKHGVITGRDREARQQPSSRQTSYDEANQSNDICQTARRFDVTPAELNLGP